MMPARSAVRSRTRPVRLLGAALAAGLLAAVTGAFAQEKKLFSDAPRSPTADAAKPAPAPNNRPGIAPQAQQINELLAKAWKANNIKPSARATNDEFIRRV